MYTVQTLFLSIREEQKKLELDTSVSLVLTKAMLDAPAIYKSAHPTLVSVCTHESLSNLSCVCWLGTSSEGKLFVSPIKML